MKINKTFALNLFILFLVTISLVLIISETLNFTRKNEGLVVIEQIKKEENSIKLMQVKINLIFWHYT